MLRPSLTFRTYAPIYALAVLLGSACSGPTVGLATPCPAGHVRVGRACAPVFDACDDDRVPRLGGGCLAVGVPQDQCVGGFLPDARGGCTPKRPIESCAAGQVALPGDDTCREIAPCPATSGAWDGIPTDASTIFVDASASVGGDGSRSRPFAKIQQAIDFGKAPIVTVAIAGGTYAESIVHEAGRTVRLWGVCPRRVNIIGVSGASETLRVSSPLEVHGIALAHKGSDSVVRVSSTTVRFDHAWITAYSPIGIRMEGTATSPPDVTIEDSLLEGSFDSAIFTAGNLAVARSAFRYDVAPLAFVGRGVAIDASDPEVTSIVTVGQSVIENVIEGIAAAQAKITVTGSVIHSVFQRGDGSGGVGVTVLQGALVTIQDSTIESTTISALQVSGGYAIVTRSGFHGSGTGLVMPSVDPSIHPAGILLQTGNLELRDSIVEQTKGYGLDLRGGTTVIERTIVRENGGAQGGGILARLSKSGPGADLTVRDCLVTNNARFGIAVWGSTATIEGSAIDHTLAGFGELGDAMTVAETDPFAGRTALTSLHARTSVFRRNEGAALAIAGGAATLDGSALSCNAQTWVTTSPPIGAHLQATSDVCGCDTLVPCEQ